MRQFPWLGIASLAWFLGLAALARPAFEPRPPASLVRQVPYEDVALGLLATSDALYSGAVGFAGTPSVQALAWNTLLQSPSAAPLFRRLFATGSRAGQLYALAGLYYADSTAYRRAAMGLRNLQDSIQTVEGCTGSRRPVRVLLQEIDSGRWSAMLRTVRPYPAQLFK